MTDHAAAAPARAAKIDSDRIAVVGLAVAVTLPLVVFVVAPLFEILKSSFLTPDGIGLGNYVRYVNSPKFGRVVGNSLAVAATTTTITVLLAYAFAYAMRRTAMPFKNALGSIALMPLFAPSLVQALGIVFLFGRNGLVNRTFGLSIDIYGFWVIVIADVFYSLPHAYLILSAALAVGDVSRVVTEASPADTVMQQTPAEKTLVNEGTPVSLVVAIAFQYLPSRFT